MEHISLLMSALLSWATTVMSFAPENVTLGHLEVVFEMLAKIREIKYPNTLVMTPLRLSEEWAIRLFKDGMKLLSLDNIWEDIRLLQANKSLPEDKLRKLVYSVRREIWWQAYRNSLLEEICGGVPTDLRGTKLEEQWLNVFAECGHMLVELKKVQQFKPDGFECRLLLSYHEVEPYEEVL